MTRIVLFLAVLTVFYSGVSGAAPANPDDPERQVLLLPPEARSAVLREMRIFLQSVAGVLHGARIGDLEQAAEQAKRSGMGARAMLPQGLMGRLPQAFRTLGMDTHRRFDQLAMDAAQMGDPDLALEQLDRLMDNCVACHAMYRIDPEPAGG